jgi:hypothetical protein
MASPGYVLGCAVLVLATSAKAVGDEDLPSKLRTACEKFTERQQLAASYGARGEIALKQLEMERYRADLVETIRNMQIEVDSWRLPLNRLNSIQAGFYQELQQHRRQLTEVDRALEELRLRWKDLNELAIRQAEAEGKRVKPLDRDGLLRELQRVDRETYSAFATAKQSLIEAASSGSAGRTDVLRSAMAEAGQASSSIASPGAQDDFLRAFTEYCGGKRFFGKGGMGRPARGSSVRKSRR